MTQSLKFFKRQKRPDQRCQKIAHSLSILKLGVRSRCRSCKNPDQTVSNCKIFWKSARGCRDHGKLAPWRLITIEGEARNIAGQKLADLVQSRDPEVSEEMLDAERTRFLPAPITIGVISAAHDHPKIPIIEQQFSAACVCFNLVHAAHALGFAAHWVTRWFAFDAEASAIFGAKEGEFFAGFVHIGTPTTHLGERPRPELADVVASWVG